MKTVTAVGCFLGLVQTVACAPTTPRAPAPVALPAPAGDAPDGVVPEPVTSGPPGELTLEQARAIVAEVEAAWPRDKDDPLLTPQSFEDAEKVLKLDQVTLFGAAIAHLLPQEDVAATALRGQIELAWGEAYIILVDLLRTLNGQLEKEVEALAARDAAETLSTEEEADLAEMRSASEQVERAGPAFAMLIVEHLNAGEHAASEARARYPESYLGYRVAADFYRLMEDWPAFAEMLAEVEKRNPDSNGMRFLRGAEAFARQKDRAAAVAFYRDALAKDPAFVRAQAHLLMTQTDPEGLHDELAKLREMNPNHQIVAWVGGMIEQAYESWKRRNP